MAPLHEALRRGLERQVVLAREAAERGAEAALARLAVPEREPHGHLTPGDRVLRKRLRARARALGDVRRTSGAQAIERLVEEVAYEAWHRMLFARFLAENGLLVHPEHGVAVSLAECEELAAAEAAEDKWVLAARYAARMLPQIFRPNDPALNVVFAPEHRVALERLLEGLAPEVFRADDSLGWVYQFWQAKKKDEVNASGEPITGETLPAVTQLFTEPYMVSFLLENTIGAWWSARHRGQAVPVQMPYLRRLEDGTPAAGTFDGWPADWSELTLLDPCCGSGHFLVAALRLLTPLRIHDDGLSTPDAVDAVLRENLYALELDPRCTQIAAFALALAAWTTPGAEGYRPLPELHIACSGLAVGTKKDEWLALAQGDQKLGAALARLYDLFKLAPELGSLIDPAAGAEDLLTASFAQVRPLLAKALRSEHALRDEQLEATAVVAQGIATAAELLARNYTLVATNVPYLVRGRQSEILRSFCEENHPAAKQDLANVFMSRWLASSRHGSSVAVVTPQSWLFLGRSAGFRRTILQDYSVEGMAILGPGAFSAIGGEVVNVVLNLITVTKPTVDHRFFAIDASSQFPATAKDATVRNSAFDLRSQAAQLANPDSRIVFGDNQHGARLLEEYAIARGGITTGDSPRFRRCFWEISGTTPNWSRQIGTVDTNVEWGGREYVLLWDNGSGALAAAAANGSATIAGRECWGREGVAVRYMGDLPCTIYRGELFENVIAVIVPNDLALLPALWAFCQSDEYTTAVRQIDRKLAVTCNTLAKVPFDVDRWTQVAMTTYPNGLPKPSSDDPTQWLFNGDVRTSAEPLQVAVARLLGYRWPDQPLNERVDSIADTDGIVCIPSVRGEKPAAERLLSLLTAAYGKDWSSSKRDHLLSATGFGGQSLDDWLRDGFFEQHTKLFQQRPFIWHVTDKAKGGFSALLNYHMLNRITLETLTYTYLGDWIDRQEDARKDEQLGADVRLGAAKDLQAKLRKILAGEPPYDVFVRWKPLHEQSIGWDPDLNDGARVNIWPFLEAGILRSRVNVNWKKDRGKNPAGSPWGEDRYNRYEDVPRKDRPEATRDVEHLTNEVKRRARAEQSARPIKGTKNAAASRR